jgi:2-polyprenyl-3-methyl-5-hydroxy-6-metoxy-1,4-benzoquinol methylase
MFSQLLTRLRALVNLPARVDAQFGRLRQELDEHARHVEQALKAQDVRRALDAHTEHAENVWKKQRGEYADVERELAATRQVVHERLLQYNLQLGRLNRLLENGAAGKEHAEPLPLVPDAPQPQPADPSPISWEWLDLERCPGCGTPERTVVCEWNKSVLLERDIFAGSKHYDYSLCHGCGIVYAAHRPVGASYRMLMADFPETIGRGSGANATNALLNPYPLSEQDRERYRGLVAAGVFVSDHEAVEHLEGVYLDRIENAAHVEILGSLLDLRGGRVLEVRSRAGTILNGLRRQFGASVAAMPIFESQRFIVQELYGIECSDVIDYDMFTIPFDGQFDLIACNHMLTHIVRPDRFFDQIRQHLMPGGHLYLYGELNEDDFLVHGKSVINTLNALHLQVFDRASLLRILKANGFDVAFVKLRNGSHVCLARFTNDRTWTPMASEERERRVRAYAFARTRAILKAPKLARGRFGPVWEEAVAEGVSAGIVRLDDKGRPRLLRDD